MITCKGRKKGSVDQKRGEDDHQIEDRLNTKVSSKIDCVEIAQRLITNVKFHVILIKGLAFYVFHKCIVVNDVYELMDLFKW
jgi:hypothetical protein